MSKRNRLANSQNPYQTDAKKVLCLCSAGLLRSPTAANVLHREYGYNTRAAGVSEDYALIPVDDVLLEWADEIVCVEPSVFGKLEYWLKTNSEHDSVKVFAKVITLQVPDIYSFMEQDLQEAIYDQYRRKQGEQQLEFTLEGDEK